MLLNYWRMAVRRMRRNKLYSVINVFCLAAGITVMLTILLYVLHEHSYDQWHANSSRIFSLGSYETTGATPFLNTKLTVVSGPIAQQADAAVRSTMRMRYAFEGADLQNTAQPEAHFRETYQLAYVDSNFFRFFSFRLLRGQAATVLARPFTVVLTQSEAKKYFGSEDVVGKTLLMDKQFPLEVTGLAADIPSNSSIHFGLVSSVATMAAIEKYHAYFTDQRIGFGSFSTWILLNEARDTGKVKQSLRRLALDMEGRTPPNTMSSVFKEVNEFRLQPVGDTHLSAASGSNARYLGPLLLVAGVILLLALVNYMSLTTARAAARAKEVGVRKVMGAGRGTLAAQFYTESIVLASAAFVLGGLLFLLGRSHFYHLMQLPIDGRFITTPLVLGFFSGLFLLILLIAGSYPALVLSGFKPVTVLYGRLSRHLGGERVRKGFIVLQFAISMTLVTGSMVIGKQLYYIRHIDTGIDRENVVMLPFDRTMEHYDTYQREVRNLPGVRKVATTYFNMYDGALGVENVHIAGRAAAVRMNGLVADSGYLSVLGLKWKEAPAPGAHWTGKERVLLNESAAAAFGLQSGAIGQELQFEGRTVKVSGVLKDFNFLSLRSPIIPFYLTIVDQAGKEWQEESSGSLYVKLDPHVNVPSTLDAVKKLYAQFDKRTSFRFEFLDEAFDGNYQREDRLAGLMDVFTIITIVIACLGLFALATFSAEQRMKEIGIRKVLGASVASIGRLLSRDFLRPVLLAVVIACPLAVWVTSRWLADFAYRTPVSGWIFLTAGIGLLGLALATVLFRSLRAARANPVENLRVE